MVYSVNLEKLQVKKNRANIAMDAEGAKAYLTTSEWQLGYCMEQWPEIEFCKTREVNDA